MGGFFILIGLVAFIYGIFALIKSVKNKKPKRNSFIILIVSFVVFMVGGAIEGSGEGGSDADSVNENNNIGNDVNNSEEDNDLNNDNNDEVDGEDNEDGEESPENDNNNSVEDDVTDAPTLGFTVEEFRNNFDKFADEFELFFRSDKDAEVEKGEVNDLQKIVTASEYVQVFATLNKEGGILALNLVGVGDGSEQSGIEIMSTIGTIVAASQPELEPEERGDILRDVGLIGESELPEEMVTVEDGGYAYSLSVSDITGVMFFVEPVE